MIDRTFTHCDGIGPVTEQKLRCAGINTWQDFITFQDLRKLPISANSAARIVPTIEKSITSLASDDIQYFTSKFATREQWRILNHYRDDITFFDIETTGYSTYSSEITVAACLHKGQMHHFVQGDNLDGFLDLLSDARLTSSFCGASFDIPHILHFFNIPEFPAPHVDLRWVAYYAGLKGGLKQIEVDLQMNRPREINGLDGNDAIRLWRLWKNVNDQEYLAKLIQYCIADVATLPSILNACISRLSRADNGLTSC